MVVLENNQISILLKMDLSKELKWKSPLGINVLVIKEHFVLSSRKHTYIILTPLNPTFI